MILFGRKREPNGNKPVKQMAVEMIGRVAAPFVRVYTSLSVDRTRPDERFYDRLLRSKEPGYELGGLFARPTAETLADWTLGQGFTATSGDDAVDERLAEFIEEHLDDIIKAYKGALGRGNAYLVVNPDATLTGVSPDIVEKETDDLDPQRTTGFKITSRLEKFIIVDHYTLKGREVIIKQTGIVDGKVATSAEPPIEFDNLTGRLPVIHFAEDMGENEIYGHPVHDGLVKLFARYDDVLNAGLDGVEIMGRPIAVAEGLEDPEQTKRAMATGEENVRDKDGVMQTVPVIDFQRLSMLFLGKGGSFKFASPGSFSADMVALLKKLFYLMLEHIRIPEWVWGGAVQSSKASVDAQMPAWIKVIQGRQRTLKKTLVELLEVWLATAALVEPLSTNVKIAVDFPDLAGEDESLSMQWLTLALENGLLTDESALSFINRHVEIVEDVAAEIAKARQEAEEKQEQFAARVDEELNRREADEDEREAEAVA